MELTISYDGKHWSRHSAFLYGLAFWMLCLTSGAVQNPSPKLLLDIYKLHAEARAGYHPAANWSPLVARRHQQRRTGTFGCKVGHLLRGGSAGSAG